VQSLLGFAYWLCRAFWHFSQSCPIIMWVHMFKGRCLVDAKPLHNHESWCLKLLLLLHDDFMTRDLCRRRSILGFILHIGLISLFLKEAFAHVPQVMTNALLPNPFNNIKQQMTKSIRAFSKDLAPSIYKAFKPIGPSGLILFHHKIRVRFSVVYKAVEVG
jgi:hypothetical protein